MTESWQKQLIPVRNQLLAKKSNPNVVILGIGNEVKGDDFAGSLAAKSIQASLPQHTESFSVSVFDCGPVPENFTGVIRKISPDYILIIDAGDFGEDAGEIGFFSWKKAEGSEISTHALPLSLLSGFLATELGCEIGLLLIQPQNLSYLDPVHPLISEAVNKISSEIIKIFS